MNKMNKIKHEEKKSLNVTFDNFKYDIDNAIDDLRNFIIDMEEVQEDLKHFYKKYCIRCCFH